MRIKKIIFTELIFFFILVKFEIIPGSGILFSHCIIMAKASAQPLQ